MLNPVSEPLVEKVLPALRKTVADKLFDRGYTQTDIAELLDITQPAVSQYLKGSRGYLSKVIKEDEELDRVSSEIATKISTDSNVEEVGKSYKEFCKLFVERNDIQSLSGSDKEYFYDLG